jgi:hypothetical protein
MLADEVGSGADGLVALQSPLSVPFHLISAHPRHAQDVGRSLSLKVMGRRHVYVACPESGGSRPETEGSHTTHPYRSVRESICHTRPAPLTDRPPVHSLNDAVVRESLLLCYATLVAQCQSIRFSRDAMVLVSLSPPKWMLVLRLAWCGCGAVDWTPGREAEIPTRRPTRLLSPRPPCRRPASSSSLTPLSLHSASAAGMPFLRVA